MSVDKARRQRQARRPRYDFAAIEAKWREQWEAEGLYRTDLWNARRPYYNLMMFPYPSAEGLHVGNMYAYTGGDVHGRWTAARGFDVFEPIGYDAFGIHSENFAIKQGLHPARLTASNIAHFREQLKQIGNRFDWSHEISSADPRYYRWTQWIFVKLFKAGLAERTKGAVNWCPFDKTVLADEQVIDGRCERCGTLVERRELDHWALKITNYADRLLRNLETLDWPAQIKAAQRNWIGRSEGVTFALPVLGHPSVSIEVFTTHAETIFGVTFVALAADHPLVQQVTNPERRSAVEAFVNAFGTSKDGQQADTPGSPSGVFTGAFARHPLTGEALPIWLADYVLAGYGTGAIMGVPAHDSRDFAFASAVGLPIRYVVLPEGGASERGVSPDGAFTGDGVVVNSDELNGLPSGEARGVVLRMIEEAGIGHLTVTYHLRDWMISRQRYWGTPIPIIYCPEHGAVPVPEDELPVLLPDVEDYRPTGTGSSPLAAIPSFVNTTCPICGAPAKRETDVADNFLDSAWYYLRYPSSDDAAEPWHPELTRKWLPVAMYVGGAEHAVLHLMYARFIANAMHDLGFLPFEEPFPHFRAHGILTTNGEKISKSKGNVINPDAYIERYGADALRTYLMFTGPYELGGDFTDVGMGGVVRFLDRVWAFITEHPTAAKQRTADAAARAARSATVEQVTSSMAAFKYNTAIAALMAYLNDLEARADGTREDQETLLVLLAPLAPYITEELWNRLGHTRSIHLQPWPAIDEEALRTQPVTLIAQVDGRLRDRLEVPRGLPEDEARARALASERVRSAIGSRAVRRVVVVPNRLVNVVTE